MNKSFIALAMIALAAVSCKSQEEKEAAFKAEVEGIVTEFNTTMQTIYEDEALSDAQKQEKAEAIYEDANAKFLETNRKAFAKNKNNKIAVMALANMSGDLTNQEILDYAASLSAEMQRDTVVVELVQAAEKAQLTEEGRMFTDFTIEDSDGQTVSFSDYVGKGKYVLVDFWASWCGPCKREIPNIIAAYEKYAQKGLEVLSVAVWDRPEDTKAAAKEHGVVWHQIINAQRIPTDLYGIQGIPQIMLFGPDGTILKRDLRGETIDAELAKYFAE